jgi:phosphopantetheinyl transferase (holo-ACP synthase)
MQNWELAQTLQNPKNPDWDKLSLDHLEDGVNPKRKHGFLLARQALKSCFRKRGIDINILDLKLQKYSQVSGFPEFTISLSHTKDAGAAIVEDAKIFRSVGIDIEQETRPVKDSVLGRISHPEDERLRNIELWCLKEAVFKTLMNTGLFEKNVEFASIKIAKDHWLHSPTKLQGEWSCEVINSFVLARAYLKN